MPIALTEDGFFRTDPTEWTHDGLTPNFVVCPAGAAVRATWFKGVVTNSRGRDDEAFVVVYLGESSMALDNDRMAALKRELPTVFGDLHLLIASSEAEGVAQLHHSYRGHTLLRWAAVLSVVQAAAMWDKSLPIHVSCEHHRVTCRPTFDSTLSQWRCEATLEKL